MMESDEDLRALDEALEAGAIDVVAKGEDDGGSGVGDVDVDEWLGAGGAARFQEIVTRGWEIVGWERREQTLGGCLEAEGWRSLRPR